MGAKGSPHKAGFLREQLEKHIFAKEKDFAAWVADNYTDAVKELGKLQPKNLTVGGDSDNPVITEIIVKHVSTSPGTTGEDS